MTDAQKHSQRLVLFPSAELAPGDIRSVEVGGVAVAVIRTPAGDVHALRDVCPHLGARLSLGYMERAVGSDGIGRYVLSDEYVLRCSWHGHEFSTATGRCLADPERIRVRSYRVTIEDGDLVLWR